MVSEAKWAGERTEMLTPKQVVAEILQLSRSSAAETSRNREFTHDSICAFLKDRLEDIGDCFGKYEQIAYQVQGPRDNGVDVLLKLSDESGPEKYIAFQVKSFEEISSEQDLSKNLKAGLHDAQSHYGDQMVRYYILFFGDSTTNYKRITAVTNEFARDSNVRVLDERYCRSFLDLNYSTIASVVDHFLRKDDKVLKLAKDEVRGFRSATVRELVSCLAVAFESGRAQTSLSSLAESTLLSAMRIDKLEGIAFTGDGSGNAIIEVASFPALRALYFDLQVRHEMERSSLVDHISKLLSWQFSGSPI